MKDLHLKLRYLRLQANISLQELECRSGIGYRTLSMLETQRRSRIRVDQLEAILAAFQDPLKTLANFFAWEMTDLQRIEAQNDLDRPNRGIKTGWRV